MKRYQFYLIIIFVLVIFLLSCMLLGIYAGNNKLREEIADTNIEITTLQKVVKALNIGE